MQDEKTFSTTELAEILNVHVRTLRIYDKEGLLPSKRTETNRMRYTSDDVLRAKAVQYLTRALNVNLNGVKIIFKLLEKTRIKPELLLEFLKDTSKSAGITDVEILNNLKRYDKSDLTF